MRGHYAAGYIRCQSLAADKYNPSNAFDIEVKED